jgi:hypothetical protein
VGHPHTASSKTGHGDVADVEAAQHDVRLARRFAWLGSGGAVLTLLFLRELAGSAFDWPNAAASWVWFGAVFLATVTALGWSLARAWAVRRRMGVIIGSVWWVAIVLAVLAFVIGDTVIARLGP